MGMKGGLFGVTDSHAKLINPSEIGVKFRFVKRHIFLVVKANVTITHVFLTAMLLVVKKRKLKSWNLSTF